MSSTTRLRTGKWGGRRTGGGAESMRAAEGEGEGEESTRAEEEGRRRVKGFFAADRSEERCHLVLARCDLAVAGLERDAEHEALLLHLPEERAGLTTRTTPLMVNKVWPVQSYAVRACWHGGAEAAATAALPPGVWVWRWTGNAMRHVTARQCCSDPIESAVALTAVAEEMAAM